MSKILLSICWMALIAPFVLLSCGENESENGVEENNTIYRTDSWEYQIISVIDEKWKKGYEEKDFTLYRSAFWEDSFEHEFEPNGESFEFDKEEEYTQNLFEQFDSIVIELTIDTGIWPMCESASCEVSPATARVEADYKIQFIEAEKTNVTSECPYKGYYAEGKIAFTFSHSGDEWRIEKLVDVPLSEETIRKKYENTITTSE